MHKSWLKVNNKVVGVLSDEDQYLVYADILIWSSKYMILTIYLLLITLSDHLDYFNNIFFL